MFVFCGFLLWKWLKYFLCVRLVELKSFYFFNINKKVIYFEDLIF